MGSLLHERQHCALLCCHAHTSNQLVRGDPRIDYTSVAATGILCSRWESRTVHLKSLHQQLGSRCSPQRLTSATRPNSPCREHPALPIWLFFVLFYCSFPPLRCSTEHTRWFSLCRSFALYTVPSLSWLLNATVWSLCSLLITPWHAMYSRKSTSKVTHTSPCAPAKSLLKEVVLYHVDTLYQVPGQAKRRRRVP